MKYRLVAWNLVADVQLMLEIWRKHFSKIMVPKITDVNVTGSAVNMKRTTSDFSLREELYFWIYIILGWAQNILDNALSLVNRKSNYMRLLYHLHCFMVKNVSGFKKTYWKEAENTRIAFEISIEKFDVF